MKVLVIGNSNYADWIKDVQLVEKVEDADIVLFTGGADVNPDLYNETPHPYTTMDKHRDNVDVHLFNKAIEQKKLIVGICRGSQLSCVMAGGKLVQHVNNHGLSEMHGIIVEGEPMEATSTHHQMMYPFNLATDKYDILAYAAPRRSNVYFRNEVNVYNALKVEPEVVWFKEIKTLAIQPHPEYMKKDSVFVKWLNKKLDEYKNI